MYRVSKEQTKNQNTHSRSAIHSPLVLLFNTFTTLFHIPLMLKGNIKIRFL